MYNVNIIFTRHYPCGRCNAHELYGIIEAIKPEILFEELSFSNFERSYRHESLVTVETNAIKMYLCENSVVHLPVDTFEVPRLFWEKIDLMYDRITRDKTFEDVRDFCYLLDKQVDYSSRHGFQFLNSKHNDEFFTELDGVKKRVLERLDDSSLFQVYEIEKEILEKREDVMLANIYRLSKENPYCQAIFFIGSGHRGSILRKTNLLRGKGDPQLNWVVYE